MMGIPRIKPRRIPITTGAASRRGPRSSPAILFKGTIDRQAQGKPDPSCLWEERGVVPFHKVDKGVETENDGVSLMRPIDGLDVLLDRAAKLGIFGTKMRCVINQRCASI
jgi:fructose-bisphosphate aldolase, class I